MGFFSNLRKKIRKASRQGYDNYKRSTSTGGKAGSAVTSGLSKAVSTRPSHSSHRATRPSFTYSGRGGAQQDLRQGITQDAYAQRQFEASARWEADRKKRNEEREAKLQESRQKTRDRMAQHNGMTGMQATMMGRTMSQAEKDRKADSRMKNLTVGTLNQIGGSYRAALGGGIIRDPNEKMYLTAEKYHKEKNDGYAPKQHEGFQSYGDLLNKGRSQAGVDLRETDYQKAHDQKEKGDKQFEKGKEGLGKTGRFMADMYGAGIGMGVDALAGLPTGGAGAMLSMAARSFGGAYMQAKDEGATDSQAALYGAGSAAVETGTEKMFGVAAPLRKMYGKGVGDKLSEKMLNKVMGKATTKGGKEVIEHTGKTLMSAFTEGLEEMVAEGLDPVLANKIYAEQTGHKHDYAGAGDYLRAGAMGAVMGGVLGGAGQVVDYGRKQGFINEHENVFGENGLKAMADRLGKIADDDSFKAKAAIYKDKIDKGEQFTANQAMDLYTSVTQQEETDRQKFSLMDKAADQAIKDENSINPFETVSFDTPWGAMTQQQVSPEAQKMVEAKKGDALTMMQYTGVARELGLEEAQADEISSAIAEIQTGVAGMDAVSMFTVDNPNARTVFEAVTKMDLPKTNAETKEELYEYIGTNKIQTAAIMKDNFNDSFQGEVHRQAASEMGPKGQRAFRGVVDKMAPENVEQNDMETMTFEDYYNAGRKGMAITEVDELANPVHRKVNKDIKKAAYEAGQVDANELKNSTYEADVKQGDTKIKRRKARHRGKVQYHTVEGSKAIGSKQQILYDRLSRRLGVNIHIVDNNYIREHSKDPEKPNYWNGYNLNGEVWLNVDADRALEYVFSHEITHHMEIYAPKEYERLRGYLKARWMEQDRDGMYRAIEAKKAQYKEGVGQELTSAQALDEILADSTYEMLQDESFLDQICREDKSLARSILDAITNAIKMIRDILVDADDFKPKQNAGLLSQLDILKDMERLWTDGLARVAQNKDHVFEDDMFQENVKWSVREKAPPKNTVIGYKVFKVIDGKLYPPKVDNPGGADTPIGIWLDADIGEQGEPTETGRPTVVQSGGGTLAFRPGWHLGDFPFAKQFNKVDPFTGEEKQLFPSNFVWAVCECAADANYQEEAYSYGINENGNFEHALAGLPYLPEDGFYRYRTNPDPTTEPWIITGAMKVLRLLDQEEVNQLVREANFPVQTRWTRKHQQFKDIVDQINDNAKPEKDGKPKKVIIGLEDEQYMFENVDEIKTFDEAAEEYIKEGKDPAEDFTLDMLKHAKDSGVITVYGYTPKAKGVTPIKRAAYVTPSKAQALEYVGDPKKLSSKIVKVDGIAWKDALIGQIASATPYRTLEGVNPAMSNEEFNRRKKFKLIEEGNPMQDDYHTGIRTADEIKTFAEALNDEEASYTPDWTEEEAREVLGQKKSQDRKLTVYSSHKIENGTFVTPSEMEAKAYAGDGKIYHKKVHINDVAWIDSLQGQYAKFSLAEAVAENGNLEDSSMKFSLREEAPPKKTKKSYKLFKTDWNGNLYALFIDKASGLELGKWYNADSPLIKDMTELPVGETYFIDKEGNATKLEATNAKKSPGKRLLEEATMAGGRYIYIGTHGKTGERLYYNWGINGAGGVSQFAMRPGWHSTNAPSARHIGKRAKGSKKPDFRRDDEVWVEIEITADVDYMQDPELDPKNGIATHLPKDGYYYYQTNTNANAAQDWYISGAIKPVRILSDEEAAKIATDMGYEADLPREDGVKFSMPDGEQLSIDFSQLGKPKPAEEKVEKPKVPSEEELQISFNIEGTNISLAHEALEDLEKIDTSAIDDVRYTEMKGLAFDRRLIKEGASALMGQTIHEPRDFAMMAQVYRDPRFETSRYVFTDADGKVVLETGVTSRLPGMTPISTGRTTEMYLQNLAKAAKTAGAVDVWNMHNHPDGDPRPSNADKRTTKYLAQAFARLGLQSQGEVIINSNKFVVIDINGHYKTHKLDLGPDKLLTPEVEHKLLNKEVRSDLFAATLGKQEQLFSENMTTALFMDAKLKVRAIMSFSNKHPDIAGFLKENIVNVGSQGAFMYTEDENIYNLSKPLIANGLALDVALLKDGKVLSYDMLHDVRVHREGILEKEATAQRVGFDRFSLPDVDSEGHELSDQQREYFKESKIVDENGRLKIMYHGTADDFTVFDTGIAGGKNGTAEGYGLYFADTKEVSDAYGGKLLIGYLNIKRPAASDQKTISRKELVDIIRATSEREARQWVDDEEYDTVEEAIKDTWISNYVNPYELPSIDKAYENVADVILSANDNDMDIVQEVMVGNAIRGYAAAYDFYEILTDVTGIDGFVTEWNNSSLESSNPMIALAFQSNQFKKIDNKTPTNDEDIRFSQPDLIDETALYDYLDEQETTFTELPPIRDYEKKARKLQDMTKDELITRLEKLQAEDKRTFGKKLNKKSVKEAVNQAVASMMTFSEFTAKKTDADLVKYLTDKVADIYTALKNDDFLEAINIADFAAQDAVERIELVDDRMYWEYRDLREDLRKTKLHVPAEVKKGITDYKDWRKSQVGRLRLVNNGGVEIDTFYDELLGLYPGMFDESLTNPADQLIEMAAVRESLEPYDEYLSAEETQILIKYVSEDLLDIAAKGSPWKSRADKQYEALKSKDEQRQELTKKLKARHKEAMRDVKNKQKETIAELKAKYREEKEWADFKGKEKLREQKQKLKGEKAEAVKKQKAKDEEKLKRQKKKHDVEVAILKDDTRKEKERKREAVRAEREKGNAKVEAEKQKARTKEEKRKAARERLKNFKDIEKNANWLSDRLLKPTDDKHIPEEFKTAVAKLLLSMDLQTERSKKLEEKYGKSKRKLKMESLRAQYAELAREDDEGPFQYDGYVFDLIDSFIKHNENGKYIDQLSDADLADIDIILKSIRHNIAMYNKAFSDNLKENISTIAEGFIKYAEARKNKTGHGGAVEAFNSLLNESSVTPRDFFKLIGGGLYDAFLGLRLGMDKHVRNIETARTFYRDLLKKYDRRTRIMKRTKPGSKIEKWRDESQLKTFEFEDGTIALNPAQMMSFYCLAKQPDAVQHITKGGIVASRIDKLSNLKSKLTGAVIENPVKVRISVEEMNEILSSLTPEQIAMADKIQEFLSNDCARWGNETSMRLFGYKKFTEENYFPIKVYDAYLAKSSKVRESVESIKNFGFTKSRDEKAQNPIEIGDIFAVSAEHVNKMSLYNAFAAPIADFMRIFNYKRRNEAGEDEVSVKQIIKTKFGGQKAIRYINNFMADLNGEMQKKSGGLTSIVTKSLANYKKALIGANLRVAIQQPTAIIRSFIMISPKYFMGNFNAAKNLRDMKKHCPIALWKSWGFSDVNMARSIDQIMMNREWSRFDAVTMEIYGALDNITWSYIWAAVRKETAKKHPEIEVDSPEFYEICNKRASDIFDSTQVVDSVFHKSQAMRNQDTGIKAMTSFMAEPTRTYNMVRTQYAEAKYLWQSGNKKEAIGKVNKATTIFLLNAATVSAAAAIMDALREGAPGDDDDDSWYANFINNFIGNINPLGMIPFGKDLMSYFTGWDSQNMAMEGWEALMKAAKDFASGEDRDKAALKMAEALGFVTGIPVKNIFREMKLLGLDVYASDGSEDTGTKKSFLQRTWDSFKDAVGLGDKSSGGDGIKSYADHDMSDSDYYGIYAKDTPNLIDKLFSRTQADLDKKAFDERVEMIKSETEGLPDDERQDAVWAKVTKNYSKYIKNGDLGVIKEMRKTLKACGGDVDKFDEKVIGYCGSGIKAQIGKDSMQIHKYRQFLNDFYDVSDATINNRFIAKSDTAKDFKMAAIADDYDGMVDTLSSLIDAGMTDEELYTLYQTRTKGIELSEYATDQLAMPVTGRITSGFGPRSSPGGIGSTYHNGIDIAVPVGTDVAAADGGKVSSVNWDSARGYYVKVNHGHGRYTLYQHLKGYYVDKGDVVKKGQIIAASGNTGNSTGPHLHFEVQENGVPVDPMGYYQ